MALARNLVSQAFEHVLLLCRFRRQSSRSYGAFLDTNEGVGVRMFRPVSPAQSVVSLRNAKPAVSSGFLRLRGRDSNPDYLIQSQASYH